MNLGVLIPASLPLFKVTLEALEVVWVIMEEVNMRGNQMAEYFEELSTVRVKAELGVFGIIQMSEYLARYRFGGGEGVIPRTP